jgi:hypothetical protein
VWIEKGGRNADIARVLPGNNCKKEMLKNVTRESSNRVVSIPALYPGVPAFESLTRDRLRGVISYPSSIPPGKY